MLVGRDLGLPNLVVLVVVFVILPVIGFVIRRKWRHAAARREEVQRLLVLASEEAARAEIEATEGYLYTTNTSPSVPSPDSAWVPAPDSAWVPAPWVPPTASVPPVSSLKPPYQCAVCFSPTTTRCAKCKAVRYCSGRCQIVHWRQGHKDECRPYVAVKPVEHEDGEDTLSDEKSLHHKNDAFQSNSDTSSSSEDYSTFSTSSRSSEASSSSSSGDSSDHHSADNFVAGKSTSSAKVNQTRSNLNEHHHDFEASSSNDTAGENMKKSGYNVEGVNVTSTVTPTNGSRSKKFDDEISWSNEKLINDLKFIIKPPSEIPKQKETKVSPSDLKFKDSKAIPESSNNVSNNKSVTSPPAYKSTRVVSSASSSKVSDVHVTSSSSSSKVPDVYVRSSSSSSSKVSDVHVTSSSSSSSSTSRLVSESTKPVTVHNEKVSVATKQTEDFGIARNGVKASVLKVVDQFKPSKLTRQCSPRPESEIAHRFSCKGLFSYETFVKLYNWKQVELRPFGLVNCGNSCYANAVLQCLTYTPPLNAYLLQGLHSKACEKREWCFTCEFEGLVLKGKGGNSPLSPIHILSQIENIGSSLGHGKQEDAHEFLRYAVDTLQSVCLKEAKTKASNSLEEETTLIGLTFGGYLRSRIKCMKCGGKSERHERMMDLTVEIGGDIGTLEEALDKFTCTEILDGENKYKCSRCKSYEKAKKQLTLLEAPNVLTIALKRFQSGKFGKLNKSIRFPEILDMAPYVSGTSDKSPVYRLYGVVVHVDVMNAAFSGHYVCYVKNLENRWFKIDDSRVKEVEVQSVLTKGAYMLLYARCSPRAPRLIRSLLSRHQHDPRKHKATATSFTSWDVSHDRERSLEEESSSSSDSSGMFSESCSCSTESIEDHISWDEEYPWRLNSSDSDTSSSSSAPSPLYPTHSPMYPPPPDHNTLREPSRVLYHVECRNSTSCREANVDRLGGRPIILSQTSKPILRRSTNSESINK